ncbi:Hypothetical predicted protein [Marmota monax]|uniref:Uncharacterized protein n=1 Tax=Marmota monax TaxID=9995 RepID=A0A5E4AH17_MARMO|nr:Hypothetical predicted protein [Marmota monax]
MDRKCLTLDSWPRGGGYDIWVRLSPCAGRDNEALSSVTGQKTARRSLGIAPVTNTSSSPSGLLRITAEAMLTDRD